MDLYIYLNSRSYESLREEINRTRERAFQRTEIVLVARERERERERGSRSRMRMKFCELAPRATQSRIPPRGAHCRHAKSPIREDRGGGRERERERKRGEAARTRHATRAGYVLYLTNAIHKYLMIQTHVQMFIRFQNIS